MRDEAASPGDPIADVARFIADFGVAGRSVREVVAALTERPHALESLIRDSGLSRRTVEGLIAALSAPPPPHHRSLIRSAA